MQLIELWETFLMQLDAGEEGNLLYGAPGAGDAPTESVPETAPVEAAEEA